eukprot:789513-Pelagomonas_calceolata.AAC.2
MQSLRRLARQVRSALPPHLAAVLKKRCPIAAQARPSSAGRSAPFFGSQPPADISPPRPAAASPSQGGLSSSMQAQAAGLRWLARWIAANYTGMGRTEMDVLPGAVMCTQARACVMVYAKSPVWGTEGCLRPPRQASVWSSSYLDLLYTSMTDVSETHAHTQPCLFPAPPPDMLTVHAAAELRRKNVVCSSVRGGQHFFRVPGHGTLDAARVAQVLNLQVRVWRAVDSRAPVVARCCSCCASSELAGESLACGG